MKIKSLALMSALALMAGYAPLSFSAGAGGSDKVEFVGTPAAGSKFSKVHEGMYSKEIMDIIGPPTDQKTFQTGKAFIPFHFGGDNYRTEYHYKGEGVLTFSGGGMGAVGSLKLIKVEVNPNESGYIH
ncbi:hypothetical protein [Dyella sp.]|uniref:hypothetical protein n=1 Tax=Dyella sp. TaxID=1869338 RepID=UPI002ED5D57D